MYTHAQILSKHNYKYKYTCKKQTQIYMQKTNTNKNAIATMTAIGVIVAMVIKQSKCKQTTINHLHSFFRNHLYRSHHIYSSFQYIIVQYITKFSVICMYAAIHVCKCVHISM